MPSTPDPYLWLEDLDSFETRSWIDSQNRKTFEFLDGIAERQVLKSRLTELADYERCAVPLKEGNRYFFLKNSGLQNQAAVYAQDGLDAIPRLILDPNTLSADGTVALTGMNASHDGRLLAYGLAGAGSDWQEWRVLDVETCKDAADHLKWIKFTGASWSADNKGFFYCHFDEPLNRQYEAPNFNQKVFYHRLGQPQSDDLLIYERPDQKEWSFDVHVTDDGRYLIIHVWTGDSHNDMLFYKDLSVDGPIVELIAKFEARYHFLGNDGPIFWLATDKDAPLGRVIAVDIQDPISTSWREIIPERSSTLEQVSIVGDRFIARYLKDGCAQVRIFDLNGCFLGDLPLQGYGTVTGFSGRRGDPETFFDFSDFTSPTTVHYYNSATGESRVFHRPRLLFNPLDFETRQVFYISKDGVRIPMFISHRRGLVLDGSNPTELYGYGGFNVSMTPGFSVSRIAWMEMGGVSAVACIRGGGEYGEEWHKAGSRAKKQNCFDDFIAAAEWLIDNKYTSSPKLAIHGRSNGGLLVGACMNQRPDLFGAAIPAVGVMDMLRFHKFTIGWAWVAEYGSPDNSEDFKVLRAYSPYHNIKEGVQYPATLIVTGDHDDRVVPGHSYKFAAALQAAHRGPSPILIRIDVRAGHGLGKPIKKWIAETADILGFYVRVLGVSKESASSSET